MQVWCGALAKQIDRIIDKIVIGLFILLIFDVWLAILDRYFLKMQIIWVEEAARYIMIWTMLLAITTALYRRQHVSVSFFYDRFPKPMRLIVARLIDALSIAIFLIIAGFAVNFAIKAWGTQTAIFKIPLFFAHASVGVSFFFAGLQLFLITVSEFHKLPQQHFDINQENLS